MLPLVSKVLSMNIKSIKNADHFIRRNRSNYEPCLCSDKNKCGGVSGSIDQFPSFCIIFPKITMENVLNTLSYCRASPVTNSSLLDKFKSEYGDGIMREEKRSSHIHTEQNTCGILKFKNILYISGLILFCFFVFVLWILG